MYRPEHLGRPWRRTHISFLARYTGDVQNPVLPTAYARESGRMLRERLVQPAPAPYPVDPLTRVVRLLRR